MTKLVNTHYATYDLSVWEDKRTVRVGHNRKLHLSFNKEGAFDLSLELHNSIVAVLRKYNDRINLRLSTCGYYTSTTRSAINDALALFGIRGSVSIAGGILTARLQINGEWEELTEDERGLIVVAINQEELENV